jgi:hypothetical protein
MFDHDVLGAGAGLHAGSIGAVTRALSAALDGPSGLDDAARVDMIRALEQLGCVVTAAQAVLARELDASRREAEAADGVPTAQRGRGVAAEVAQARRESPHRGQRHLGLAKAMPELPQTGRASPARPRA